MRFLLVSFLIAITGLYAQAQRVDIQPAHLNTAGPEATPNPLAAKTKPIIAVPTLGFLADAEGRGLVPIRGVASAPSLGEPLAKPIGVGRIYLPARQHYALVEQASPGAIAIWHLARRHVMAGKDMLDTISGALAHPDLVAFSPRASAAAFYSSSRSEVQIVNGLPNKPAVQAELPTSSLGPVTALALSDDGQIVLAINSIGEMELSNDGKTFRAMPWNYSPLAVSFVANTHNVLLSDARENQLILLLQIEAQSSAPVVIGSGLQPNHLAAASDGGTMMALDAINQKLWQIDANTFSVTSLPVKQASDTLITLRDGHTFLVSTSPLSLVKLGDSATAGAIVTSSAVNGDTQSKQ